MKKPPNHQDNQTQSKQSEDKVPELRLSRIDLLDGEYVFRGEECVALIIEAHGVSETVKQRSECGCGGPPAFPTRLFQVPKPELRKMLEYLTASSR